MSTLIHFTQAVSAQLTHTHPRVVLEAAGTGTVGILDWINAKSSELQTVGRGLAVTFGIVFVIYQAIVSRGAMARVIIAGIAAGIFIWIVWNVTALKDRVGQEVNATRAPATASMVNRATGVIDPVAAARPHHTGPPRSGDQA